MDGAAQAAQSMVEFISLILSRDYPRQRCR